MINRVSEVDRHTDNSIVENRNKMISIKASAMAFTAMGENEELYWRQAGCELVRWANECLNHRPISTAQKKEGIAPHQQQYGGKESLQDASEIEIKAWGELTYIYVKKKDRDGKLAPKAVRCI